MVPIVTDAGVQVPVPIFGPVTVKVGAARVTSPLSTGVAPVPTVSRTSLGPTVPPWLGMLVQLRVADAVPLPTIVHTGDCPVAVDVVAVIPPFGKI